MQDFCIKMYVLYLNKVCMYSNHTLTNKRGSISLANCCYHCQFNPWTSVPITEHRVFFQGLFVEPSWWPCSLGCRWRGSTWGWHSVHHQGDHASPGGWIRAEIHTKACPIEQRNHGQVRCTGRKCLIFPMSWWDSQNGGDSAGVGEKDPWEGNNAKKANHHIQQDVIDECVWAGKCEDLSKFTIKVWNGPVGTEGQLQHQQTLDQGVWQAGEPRHKNQQTTEARVHDDRVVQGVTDGHKVVIGHHSQGKSVHTSKNHEKNTSGWCSLHSWWIYSVSGCSQSSWGQWWRWNQCQPRTSWKGRSTWWCGHRGLSWWPG